MLLVVNSICGCAAGVARPGVARSLQNPDAPKNLATGLRGPGRRGDRPRQELLRGIPALLPQIAILGNGRLLFMLQRHEIEGRTPEQIAAALAVAYQKLATPAA